MAQGKYKASKLQVPGKKKEKHGRPKGVIKKGHLQIAPKKARLVEAAKLKKDLEKGIRACIEEEVTAKTVSLEPRSLSMLKPSTSKKTKKNKS
ncbi:leydig cell tumor 10 kDa protein homolog [Physella acuta]|uniref:leydig cell tumor 10 kDa protein homolog n=1 Tax=Physella acuta TaxID=109671 RepID=UPI0027DAD617|nr:leydig cell tumor 10 kDa protein homolog [Physella acuta]